MGTFHYLAPEQRKDARGVDHRADVWALGVILYEMLTGELPLGSFAAPSTLGPTGTDRRVDAIVNRALAPDPAARYANVAELARDVRKLVAPRRIQRVAIAGAAVLALAVGSTAVALSSNDDAPATPRAAAALDAGPTVVAVADASLEAPRDATEVAAAPPDASAIAAVLPAAGSPASRPKPPRKSTKPKPGGKTGTSKVPSVTPVGKVKRDISGSDSDAAPGK
jgi:hypothetical protein